MITVERANLLVRESRLLTDTLSRKFQDAELAMLRNEDADGNENTDRLYRILQTSRRRLARRRDAQADARWPQRIEQRRMAALLAN
jgi:hypothetical protein